VPSEPTVVTLQGVINNMRCKPELLKVMVARLARDFRGWKDDSRMTHAVTPMRDPQMGSQWADPRQEL
jgi:hypothetical protein